VGSLLGKEKRSGSAGLVQLRSLGDSLASDEGRVRVKHLTQGGMSAESTRSNPLENRTDLGRIKRKKKEGKQNGWAVAKKPKDVGKVSPHVFGGKLVISSGEQPPGAIKFQEDIKGAERT